MTDFVPVAPWDEYERGTAARRPSDWHERPGGPDRLDWLALDLTRAGGAVTRETLLALMNPHDAHD